MDRDSFFTELVKTKFEKVKLDDLLTAANKRLNFHRFLIGGQGAGAGANESEKFYEQTLLEIDVINSALKYVKYLGTISPNTSIGSSVVMVKDNRTTTMASSRSTTPSKKKMKVGDSTATASGGQDNTIMVSSGGNTPLELKTEDNNEPTTQPMFKLYLITFDEAKTEALINQVKHVVGGIDLAQAKVLVGSLPQLLRANLSKADAEALKKKIEANGGVCTVE